MVHPLLTSITFLRQLGSPPARSSLHQRQNTPGPLSTVPLCFTDVSAQSLHWAGEQAPPLSHACPSSGNTFPSSVWPQTAQTSKPSTYVMSFVKSSSQPTRWEVGWRPRPPCPSHWLHPGCGSEDAISVGTGNIVWPSFSPHHPAQP